MLRLAGLAGSGPLMSNVRPLNNYGVTLSSLLPIDKHQTDEAASVVALGFPTVEPLLPDILKWMQDLNWPVAKVFRPFLVSIGAPLAPHIAVVLAADDDIWKYWLLSAIVGESPPLARALRSELERLALNPTLGESREEVSEMAQQILKAINREPEA